MHIFASLLLMSSKRKTLNFGFSKITTGSSCRQGGHSQGWSSQDRHSRDRHNRDQRSQVRSQQPGRRGQPQPQPRPHASRCVQRAGGRQRIQSRQGGQSSQDQHSQGRHNQDRGWSSQVRNRRRGRRGRPWAQPQPHASRCVQRSEQRRHIQSRQGGQSSQDQYSQVQSSQDQDPH